MIMGVVTGPDTCLVVSPLSIDCVVLASLLQMALQKGLVDQIGTFENAVDEAKKLAGSLL